MSTSTHSNDLTLRIGAEMARSRANGPGWRYVVWTQGCSRGCTGCHNPQLSDPGGGNDIDVESISVRVLQTADIEGVTFSGGEPFEQARACGQLARDVREAGLSVVCYTGYRLSDIIASGDQDVAEFITHCDALIDGPFVSEMASASGMIGSTNQRLHLLSDRYTRDDFRGQSVASSEYAIGERSLRRTGCSHGATEEIRQLLEKNHGILLP